MLKANLSSASRLKNWCMLEMCLVKEVCPSCLGSLLHIPAMPLFECQWGSCNEPKGCLQTWDSLWICRARYRVTFANQLQLQLEPNFNSVKAQKHLFSPWQPHGKGDGGDRAISRKEGSTLSNLTRLGWLPSPGVGGLVQEM